MNATMSKAQIRWSRSVPNVPGLAGAIAGGLAGALTVLLSLIANGVTSGSAITLLDHIAVALLRADAFALSSSDALIASAFVCVAGLAALGAIFGVVYRRVLKLTTDFGLPIYAGLAYGMVVYLVIAFGVLRIVDPALVVTTASLGVLMAQTALFGMALGAIYMLLRPATYRNLREYV